MRTHELESLTSPQLRALLDRGVTTVIVPFGSIEHQAGHLPVGADALLADVIGREVAARLGAVLAPTVRLGCAAQHAHLPGTVSLRSATLTDLAVELGASLVKQGFRTIALVSTHGGNAGPLDAAVGRLAVVLEGGVVCAPRGDVGPHPGSHSGEWLSSVLLAVRPDLVEIQAAPRELRDELRSASADRGRAHLERFVNAVVDAVRASGR